MIKQYLQRQEFKVCTFIDPFAALAHFNSDSQDYHNIVLSDIRMPGMNSYEFIRKVKESNLEVKSLEEYLGHHPLIYLKKGLANYAKMEKDGLSVLADLGAYPHKSKYKDLVDYELSFPTKYVVPMKGFCLYHQKDFDNL